MSDPAERKPTKLYVHEELSMLTDQYQRRECGCFLAVGIRLDNKEMALALNACPAHYPQATRTIERFRESLKDPLPTPAITVLSTMFDEELGAKPH